MTLPQHGSTPSLEARGHGRLLSETSAGNTAVWEERGEDSVTLRPADHVPDFHVQLHQFGADFRQTLVRSNQCVSTCLPQRLVTEINIQ